METLESDGENVKGRAGRLQDLDEINPGAIERRIGIGMTFVLVISISSSQNLLPRNAMKQPTTRNRLPLTRILADAKPANGYHAILSSHLTLAVQDLPPSIFFTSKPPPSSSPPQILLSPLLS